MEQEHTPQLSSDQREKILQARAQKYKAMGIPQPIAKQDLEESVAVSNSYASPTDAMSRLEQIKRGALKKDFQKIITKVESGTIVHPESFQAMPANRGSVRPQNQPQKKSAPPLVGFAPERTSGDNEALQMEQMLYGGGGNQRAQRQQNYYEDQGYQPGLHYEQEEPQVQPQYPQQRRNEEIISEDIYAPPALDYKAILEERFGVAKKNKQVVQEQAAPTNNALIMKKLNELEKRMTKMVMDVSEQIALKLINEMTSEIATEVAKKTAIQTTKNIILEFGKNGKSILVETAKIKKAEIVADNKVKIDGKFYKLTEIKA